MTGVSIDVDMSDAEAMLNHVQGQIEKPAKDSVAARLTQILSRELERSLMRQGSVSSGEGLASIKPVHVGDGIYGIEMKKYLDYVDQGTQPHNVPVKNNYRFQEWAEQKGLNPYAVARSIAKKGTEAHPFQETALEAFRSQAKDAGADELAKQLRK